MPLSPEEAQVLGAYANETRRTLEAQQAEINALKAQRVEERFRGEIDEAHGFLRQKGLTDDQIALGEQNMARFGTTNHFDAFKLGYFPKGRIGVGGMTEAEIQEIWRDNGWAEQKSWEVIAEERSRNR